tara:strand:+ start:2135 stop:2410 length:276 start_codon:yes stop_codon:yes gene_type:complete
MPHSKDNTRLHLTIPVEMLGAVERAAEAGGVGRAEYIRDAVKARLTGQVKQGTNYAKAVAAAQSAGQGKLSRVDAESVAARVICAFVEEPK